MIKKRSDSHIGLLLVAAICIIAVLPLFAFAQLPSASSEYIELVQQKIAPYIVYPTQAIHNGWEGMVTLRLILGNDGRVKDISVAESSGYAQLDEEAVIAAKNAGPYPPPIDYVSQNEVAIFLPLEYRINGMDQYDGYEQISPEYAFSYDINPYTPDEYGRYKKNLSDFDAGKYRSQSVEPDDYGMISGRTGTELVTMEVPYENLPAENLQIPAPRPYTTLEQQVMREPSETISSELIVPTADVDFFKSPKMAVKWPEDLSKFISTALKNNKPSQVAKKEIDLAAFKVTESMRNFFPAAKVSGYSTDGKTAKTDDFYGTTDNAGYDENALRLELSQPIYYGGRLLDTLEYNKVNLEIAKRNYDRVRADVVLKTESAYYNLIATRTHLKQKEILRDEAKELLNKIEKLADIGMIIPLELKSARSSFEQIEFQLASLKEDLYLAELALKQILNSDELPELPIEEPELVKPELDLDSLYTAALRHRPEVYIGELMVKFNKYAKRIELDKDNFQVDFVGYVEEYWGAWKTEKLKHNRNWAAGLKASKLFGASTLKGAYNFERLKPGYGKTAPQQTSTFSAEYGVFDNLQSISSKKRADVELRRALSDLGETKKTVTFEVQDSYLNYQKSILQLNTSAADMLYRRNQAEITKIKASVNDAPLSSAIDSLYSYSDAQSKYYQAIGNYFIALAKLRKATGYSVDF
jgi:TonB family protein